MLALVNIRARCIPGIDLLLHVEKAFLQIFDCWVSMLSRKLFISHDSVGSTSLRLLLVG